MKCSTLQSICLAALFSIGICTGASGQSIIWSPIGPAPQYSGTSPGAVSGRIWSIAIAPPHPGKRNFKVAAMMFIAPEGGGIWRSKDFQTAAPTWVPVADDQLPNAQVINSIAVSASQPNLLYAGSQSRVLYSSSDEGSHWLPIQTLSSSIQKVIVHPVTGKVFVATYNINDMSGSQGAEGVYVQGPNGFDPITKGLPTATMAFGDMDYVTDVAGNITLYLGLRSSNAQSPDVGIYTFTEASGQWQKSALALFDMVTRAPLPLSAFGSVRLAMDHKPGAPNGIYTAVTNRNTNELLNVFGLTQSGWSAVGNGINNLGLRSTFADVLLGISESGSVYVALGNVPDHAIYQTVDRGAHWVNVRNGTNGLTPHTDERSFAFYDDKVYLGDDGGLNRFTPLPNSAAGRNIWESLNSPSLQTILVNGVGPHPTESDVVLVGSQDNSIALRTNSKWVEVFGDDNSKVLFDPDASNNGKYAYTTGVSEYSFFFRSDDQGQTWADKSPVDANDAVGHQAAGIDWYAPFAIHPANTQRIVAGIDRVYESFNRGDDWGTQKSPIFNPTGMRADGRPYGSQATAITFGMNDRIWVAYRQKLYLTTDDGGNAGASEWPSVDNGTNFGGNIIQIRVTSSSPNRVYLASSNNIWESQFSFFPKAHWNWIDRTGNLPVSTNVQVQTLQVVDRGQAVIPLLIAGTSGGAFISFDDGNSWGSFETLPKSSVEDLEFGEQTQVLVAGFYGRGVYSASLANVLARNGDPRVKILRPVPIGKPCMPDAVEGSTIPLSYILENPLDTGSVKTSWTVTGATIAAGDDPTAAAINIVLPSAAIPVVVSVEVDLSDGLRLTDSVNYSVADLMTATLEAWYCKYGKMRLKPIPWWEWDPELWEWDQQSQDIRLRPETRTQLLHEKEEIEHRMRDLDGRIHALDDKSPNSVVEKTAPTNKNP